MRIARPLLLALVALGASLCGCLGQFATFERVRDFNLQASDNKWVQEGLFVVLNIVPVYGGALVADALVVNSIEFWTGENPVSNRPAITASGLWSVRPTEDIRVTYEKIAADRVKIEIYDKGVHKQTFTLERTPESLIATDAGGSLLGMATL